MDKTFIVPRGWRPPESSTVSMNGIIELNGQRPILRVRDEVRAMMSECFSRIEIEINSLEIDSLSSELTQILTDTQKLANNLSIKLELEKGSRLMVVAEMEDNISEILGKVRAVLCMVERARESKAIYLDAIERLEASSKSKGRKVRTKKIKKKYKTLDREFEEFLNGDSDEIKKLWKRAKRFVKHMKKNDGATNWENALDFKKMTPKLELTMKLKDESGMGFRKFRESLSRLIFLDD